MPPIEGHQGAAYTPTQDAAPAFLKTSFPPPPTGGADRIAETARARKEKLNAARHEDIPRAFDPSSKVGFSGGEKRLIAMSFLQLHREAFERLGATSPSRGSTAKKARSQNKRKAEDEILPSAKKVKEVGRKLIEYSFVLVNSTSKVHCGQYTSPTANEYATHPSARVVC